MLTENDFKTTPMYEGYCRAKHHLNNCNNLEEFFQGLDELSLDKDSDLYKQIERIEKDKERRGDTYYEDFIGVEYVRSYNSYNWNSPIIFDVVEYIIENFNKEVKYKVTILKFHIGLDVRCGYTDGIYFVTEVEDKNNLTDFEEYMFDEFLYFSYDRFGWSISLGEEDGFIKMAFSDNEDENQELESYDYSYFEEFPDYFVKAYGDCKGYL